MIVNREEPRILAVGQEPPPLDLRQERRPAAAERSKAKGTGEAGQRFKVINAFACLSIPQL